MRIRAGLATTTIAFALAACGSTDQPAAAAHGPSTARRDQPGGGSALSDAKAHGEARAIADMKSAEVLERADARNAAESSANMTAPNGPKP